MSAQNRDIEIYPDEYGESWTEETEPPTELDFVGLWNDYLDLLAQTRRTLPGFSLEDLRALQPEEAFQILQELSRAKSFEEVAAKLEQGAVYGFERFDTFSRLISRNPFVPTVSDEEKPPEAPAGPNGAGQANPVSRVFEGLNKLQGFLKGFSGFGGY